MKTFTTNEFGCSVMQPNSILSNIEATKQFVKSNFGIDTQSFWEAIKALQHNDLNSVIHVSSEPEIVWYEDSNAVFQGSLKNLMGNVDVPQDASYKIAERKYFEEKYYSAIQQFKKDFPDTFETFRSVISYIVFARRPGYSGGTVSNRIGLIWLAPELDWKDEEWLENLVHEFTHNVLFLDDMINGIFTEGAKKLEEEDALAISAIRQVKRGYDKSYHSAFVSYSIIEHYLKLEKLAFAEKFIDPLIICLEDLVINTKYISEHGKAILFELAELALETRKNSLVMAK